MKGENPSRFAFFPALIASPVIQAAIADEASRRGISTDAARQQAQRFLQEIAARYSPATMRFAARCFAWLWPRLYDAIEVYRFEQVTKQEATARIVYIPAHRSHLDYLLLSYLLHDNGFTPPHIAAGANLNLPLVGRLLRHSGAFFLRRSFKGEPLYAAVFHEYLHLILTRGFPLEYFIEGGRSRSGRTLNPKAGMLAMTVRSFIREHTRPLVFVPVYIGYEKVMEGRTYVRELAGKPKQKESLWVLLKSARQIKRVFGKVHVNFGEPLPLAEFLERSRPGWAGEDLSGADGWSREVTQGAALELARRINSAVVINPVNLVALALLSTPRHTADEQVLDRVLAHYQALVAEAPYSTTIIPCHLAPRQIVSHVERLGIIERIAHSLGDLIRIPEGDAPLLAYFRNNVLHVFALPALIACLINQNRHLDERRVNEAVVGIYGLMATELFLRWSPDELPAVTATVIEVLVRRGLLQRNASGRLLAPETSSQEFAELRLLGETLRPILERHFLTLSLLQHYGTGRRARRDLENDCHLLAGRLALLYDFNTPEFAEKATFSALIGNLIEAQVLREDETGLLHFDEQIGTPLAQAELVLPVEARQTIRRMASAGLVMPD